MACCSAHNHSAAAKVDQPSEELPSAFIPTSKFLEGGQVRKILSRTQEIMEPSSLPLSPPPSPQPPAAKKPKGDRHVKGSKITLSAALTDRVYAAKQKVEESMATPSNKLTAGGMVAWLLDEAADKLRGLQSFMSGIVSPPRPSGKSVQPGIGSLAPGISPGRVLPAFGRPNTII